MSTLSWSTALSAWLSSVNRENVDVARSAGSMPLDSSGAAGCAGATGAAPGCLRPVRRSTRDMSAPLAGEDVSQRNARAVGAVCGLTVLRDAGHLLRELPVRRGEFRLRRIDADRHAVRRRPGAGWIVVRDPEVDLRLEDFSGFPG